jgi:hypothetical protein
MTTPLHKPVARKAAFTRDAGRRIVVTLTPGDVISLRAEGTRTAYDVTIGAVYSLAVKQEIARKRAEKAAAKKAKKGGKR